MDRRTPTLTVARNVSDAITEAGCAPESVAAAADMQPSDLNARLHGDIPFTVSELAAVGGFLHVAPDHLLEGAVA